MKKTIKDFSKDLKRFVYVARPTRKEARPKALSALIIEEAKAKGVLVSVLASGGTVVHFDEVLGYSDFQRHIRRKAGRSVCFEITPLR